MYLVSKGDLCKSKDPINTAIDYTNGEEFTRLITPILRIYEGELACGTRSCNNLDLLSYLQKHSSIKSLECCGVDKALVEEIKPITSNISERLEGTYDYIFDNSLIEQNDEFYKEVDEKLNEDGVYQFVICFYEEKFLMKKLLHFMIKAYSVKIVINQVEGLEVPVILFDLRKARAEINNKKVIVDVNGAEEEMEVKPFLAKLKDIYLQGKASLKELVAGRFLAYEAYEPFTNELRPKYTFYIYDNKDETILNDRSYSCFIVPVGLEYSSLYRTEEGLAKLGQKVRTSRIAVAILMPGSEALSYEEIKSDIESIVVERKPELCMGNIIFMTDNSQDYKKKLILKNDTLIIEDIAAGSDIYRRFVLNKNYHRLQAEVHITDVEGQAHDDNWGLYPKKEGRKISRNVDYFEGTTQRTLFLALATMLEKKDIRKIAFLGLGSGLLNDFCIKYITGVEKDEVEISETVVDTAINFLGLERSKNDITIADGYNYLTEAPESSLDAIVLDLDDPEFIKETPDIMPPQKFRQEEFFKLAASRLSHSGILIYNMIHTSTVSPMDFQNMIHSAFKTIIKVKVPGEVNTVYVCLNNATITPKAAKDQLQASYIELGETMGAEKLEEYELDDIIGAFEVISA